MISTYDEYQRDTNEFFEGRCKELTDAFMEMAREAAKGSRWPWRRSHHAEAVQFAQLAGTIVGSQMAHRLYREKEEREAGNEIAEILRRANEEPTPPASIELPEPDRLSDL